MVHWYCKSYLLVTMAFIDALKDTCTIYDTTSSSVSSTGKQTKSQAVRYSSIRCRLHARSSQARNVKAPGSSENFKNDWTLMVEPIYNSAVRGDRVTIGSQNYIITRAQEVKGISSSANHVVYTLEEQE